MFLALLIGKNVLKNDAMIVVTTFHMIWCNLGYMLAAYKIAFEVKLRMYELCSYTEAIYVGTLFIKLHI